MGFYINPKVETKEDFLAKHGTPVTREEAENFDGYKSSKMLPVCLVQNDFFTAAAVAYSSKELRVFSNPADERPKLYFLVPKHLLDEEVNIDPKSLERMVNVSSPL